MKKMLLVAAALIPLWSGAAGHPLRAAAGPQGSAPRTAPPATSASPQQALVKQYCVRCHNDRLKTAGLVLDTADLAAPANSAETGAKVTGTPRWEARPPPGMPRPDKAASDAFASWLEAQIDAAASRNGNPGRTPNFHRLNRTEYHNAIRDLLALDIDTALLLPADDAAFGFDNIADVLSTSPTLMDRYLSAANRISRLAVGDPTIRSDEMYSVSKFLVQEQDRMNEDMPFGSRGGAAMRHYFPLDGEYSIKVRVDGISNPPERMQILIDGVPVGEHSVIGQVEESIDSGAVETRTAVKAGSRVIAVAFVKQTLATEGRFPTLMPWGNSAVGGATTGGRQFLRVASVDVRGPEKVLGPGDTPSRRQIFVCRPARVQEEDACARRIMATLARRAYRQPVASTDLDELLRFYRDARAKRGFEGGIQAALERLLVDPGFLFRVEREPAKTPSGGVYKLADLDLASRLSFFLWSSIPDDELLQTAERGRLSDPAVLEKQVRRLLADPRSSALVSNFGSQWLHLRNVQLASPDSYEFPEWDDNLRAAMTQETELFLESQIREDRGVVELLTANYTFLNERLARHYRIPGVYGSHFRRHPLPDATRAGILGHASILTVTSAPNRTSPVVRGKWLLENILGAPPPPPPADVPDLPEDKGVKSLTLRERMAQHRKNPTCATCHAVLDPLGFALENYNAIGGWRTIEAGHPIDSSGALPDGSKIDGPSGLRQLLASRREAFAGNVAEKLLTYALGRGLTYSDMPAVRKIVRDSAPADYKWSSIIVGVARSLPFQMEVKE